MALEWNGDKIAARVNAARRKALLNSANHVKERAVERTPLETGALRNSATASVGDRQAAVSYNTPYAVKQHEEVGYQHQDGEAKFLENAMRSEADAVKRLIAQAYQEAMK